MLATIKKTMFIKPHPKGLPFIFGGLIAAIILVFVAKWLGALALAFTLFCVFFFRDPQRVTPQVGSLVISPADGVVNAIAENIALPAELDDSADASYTRISIFLSVIDVHVNRIPVSGKIIRKVYHPGKFFNADLDKASVHNERCGAVIETAEGRRVGVVQIAGFVARRIVNQLNEGDSVAAGARFGIIRFGSRLDVYLPRGVAPLVCVGQRAIGGETVLAEIGGAEIPRAGKVM